MATKKQTPPGPGMNSSRVLKLDRNNNPGAARFCEEHDRLECTKRKRGVSTAPGQCHGPAVRGTDACKTHSGRSKAVQKARGEAMITAWSAMGKAQNPVSSSQAVLAMLQMSWMRAAAYGALLKRQVESGPDLAGSAGDGPLAVESGLIGFKYGMGGKDGVAYVQGEEARALVNLESAERDRVVKYAKTAHDMGISDRMTALAEQWAELMAGRLMLLLDGLSLTPEQQRRVPELVEAHLGTIDVDISGENT